MATERRLSKNASEPTADFHCYSPTLRFSLFAVSPAIAGITFYARKEAALPPPQLAALLIDFSDKHEAGRRFVQQAQLDGLRLPAANEFRMNDAFLPETRRQLQR